MASVQLVCTKCGEDIAADEVHGDGPCWHRECLPDWIQDQQAQIAELEAALASAHATYCLHTCPDGPVHEATCQDIAHLLGVRARGKPDSC